MAKLSKEQVEALKAELSHEWGRQVYFRIDGYFVVACCERNKMRLKVAVYVNGSIKGKDCWTGWEDEADQMTEVARRFYHYSFKNPNKKYVVSYEKIYGKRECKKRGVYRKWIFAWPYFNTAGAFLTHIQKQNEKIEVLSREEYWPLLDAHLAENPVVSEIKVEALNENQSEKLVG